MSKGRSKCKKDLDPWTPGAVSVDGDAYRVSLEDTVDICKMVDGELAHLLWTRQKLRRPQ